MFHSPVWPDPKALLNDPTLTSPSLRSSTTNSSTGIGCRYTWYPWWPFWVTNRVATSTLLNRNIWSFCNRYIITNINFWHSREDSTFFWMSLMITHIKILHTIWKNWFVMQYCKYFYLITTSIFFISFLETYTAFVVLQAPITDKHGWIFQSFTFLQKILIRIIIIWHKFDNAVS